MGINKHVFPSNIPDSTHVPKIKNFDARSLYTVLHPFGFCHRAALLMIFSLYVSHDTSASMLCNSNHAPVV